MNKSPELNFRSARYAQQYRRQSRARRPRVLSMVAPPEATATARYLSSGRRLQAREWWDADRKRWLPSSATLLTSQDRVPERVVVATDPTNWWETFFDEAYVRAWDSAGAFQSTDDTAADLFSFLQLEPGAAILDIPCGFGRFSRPLHEAGYDVVGVDGSPDQIRLARQHHPGPRYEVGDMREPPPGPFDAVLNLYSSFGYFDDPADDAECLRAWYRVLRPGGALVLETMHRDRLAWLWGQESDPGIHQEAGTTDWATGVRTSYVQVDGETRMFRVRVYTVTALVEMMAEIGFTSIEVYGGLDRSPLDPSTRLAVRAQR